MFEMLVMILMMTLTLTLMIKTMMVINGDDGDDNDNDDNDDGGGGGVYYCIHQSVSAVHSAGEALSSLSGHNVDKLKQYRIS